jgi:hypothetical protein
MSAENGMQTECRGYSRRADGNRPMIPTTETAPENRRGRSGTVTSVSLAIYTRVSTADQIAEL